MVLGCLKTHTTNEVCLDYSNVTLVDFQSLASIHLVQPLAESRRFSECSHGPSKSEEAPARSSLGVLECHALAAHHT